jgi:hypothetical protein
MKKLSLLILLISISFMSAFSQGVGINNTNSAPDASSMLDVSSTNKGLLLPRLALTQTTSASPVTSPVTSLLVYNTATVNDVTPGYYYWNGSAWVRFISGSTANLTFNNSGSGSASGTVYNGTTPYTISYNTIGAVGGSGTTDYLARWTTGSTLGTGVTRDNNSTVGINIAPSVSYRLYVDGASAMTSVRGLYSATRFGDLGTSNYGAYGQYDANNYGYIGSSAQGGYFHGGVASSSESYVKLAVSNWEGVYAYAYNDDAIEAHAASSSYYAIKGTNDNASGGIGIRGDGYQAGIMGNSANGTGVFAFGTTTGLYASATTGLGVDSRTSSTNQFHYATFGFNSATNGTGIAGVGNNEATYYILNGGSGGAFNGYQNSATYYGIGVYGRGENVNAYGGVGGYFQGYVSSNSSYAYVAAYFSGTQYKITGSGTVSTIVKDNNNELVTLHCPETPEVYFQDFGEAQLVNGKVHIDIDPTFAKNIAVNDNHPLHVIIQLYDDENCKGVIVKNRTKNGFDVVELNNGTSNAKLSWFVTANRADELNENGEVISKYQDLRFEKGAKPSEVSGTKTDSNLPKIEEPEKNSN